MEFNEAGAWVFETVETVLRRRGHVVARTGEIQETLFPEEQLAPILHSYMEQHPGEFTTTLFGPEPVQRYMEFFGRTGVRKMFRQLVFHHDHARPAQELATIAGKRFENAMAFFEALQVLERDVETVRLLRKVPDLGKSLEHYIAKLCLYELRGTAIWGVSLEGVSSGDFDVIAWMPPILAYVECKSGAPADITQSDLQQVLRRTTDLAPDLAIVLVDTEDDIGPVAQKLRSAEISLLPTLQPEYFLPPTPQPDFGGIHFGMHQHWPIYVAGGRPSLLAQLRWCLRHFHSQAKWR